MREDTAPGVTGFHHVSFTVSDIEASAAWYQRLLGAHRIPMKFDHYGREDTGYGVLLVDQRSGLVLGLHTNTGNDGDPFNEAAADWTMSDSTYPREGSWRPGWPGSTSLESSTPASETGRNRSHSRRWCSATPTTSNSSSSPSADVAFGRRRITEIPFEQLLGFGTFSHVASSFNPFGLVAIGWR